MNYINNIKITKNIYFNKSINLEHFCVGKISIKPNKEYIWNYNNYFKGNKFIKPYDTLDWLVIGPRGYKYSYKLTEGDFLN